MATTNRIVGSVIFSVSFDRRAAFLLWIAATAAIGSTVALSESEARPLGHDPEAFARLTGLLEASAGSDWLVEYSFTRTSATGDTITSPVTEARRGEVHVVRGATSAQVETSDVAYRCQMTGAEVSCLELPASETLTTADVVRTLVDRDVYVVTAVAGEPIAGERTECFRVFGARGFLPELGIEREYCFTEDAIPLRTKVVDLNVEDELVAVRVERDPSEAALDALLMGLEAAAAEGEE